jgi:hypothetical protein
MMLSTLSIDETMRRIDGLRPGDCCGELGWLVYPNGDGDVEIYTCPCVDERLLTLDDDTRESLHVGDVDVRQLPDAITARRIEQRRQEAIEGPQWERDS